MKKFVNRFYKKGAKNVFISYALIILIFFFTAKKLTAQKDAVAKVEREAESNYSNNKFTAKNTPGETVENNEFDNGSPVINSIAENMVLVDGGSFTLGCLTEQGMDCPTDQLPKVSSLKVSSFYLSKFEVTQAQWKAVMGSNPSHFTHCDNCPVEMVGWNDVQEFLKKLNEMTGKHYRLPTELEWEFAAKEGTKSGMNVYSGSNDIDSVAWYGNNSDGTTHEVGSKKPNALGLYDLSGNVFELCNSFYTDDLTQYQNASAGIAHGAHRVLRGGSWRYFKREAHVSYRINSTGKTYEAGLRLATDK